MKTENPKITVLLPVYNAEKYLEEAIDSILAQTYSHFELVLLNDGSTDGSSDIIQRKQEKDARITIIANAENRGLIYTLNRGLEQADGKYIARMDADDIARAERFQKQVEFLEAHPEIAVLGTNITIFGKEDKVSALLTTPENIRLQLYFENALAHPTVMMRTEIIKENNLTYDKAFLHLEDWGLWLSLIPHGRFANLTEPLLDYRMEGQNISEHHLNSLEERAKKLYAAYLPSIYGKPLTEEELDQHWRIAKNRYQNESLSELKKRFALLKKTLVNSGQFDEKAIAQFITRKKKKLLYAIINDTPWKGILFAGRHGLFSPHYLRYALGAMRKNGKKK